jgi:hypothetical protein
MVTMAEETRMNVHPGLLNHPKFLAYKRALGDPRALEFLIRIWGHCQDRQLGENWGNATPSDVEAIAGWDGKPLQLWSALTMPLYKKKGFIDRINRQTIIVGWEEMNHAILNSWNARRNGALKKHIRRSSTDVSTDVSTDNPRIIHGASPDDPIGLDGTGLDGSGTPQPLSHPVRLEFQEPSLPEVLAYADMHGILPDCARKFFWEKKAIAWIQNGAPIVDWKAKLQGYFVSWRGQDYLKKPRGAAASGAPGLEQLEAELQAETDPEKRKALRRKMEEMSR